jgi:hypothetical protein
MLFNKTNNKNIIHIFNILCEVFIGFTVFALFFVIFMTYYFTEYQTALLGTFIDKSVSYYKISSDSNILLEIKNLIKKLNYKQQLETNIAHHEKEVHDHNKPYDKLLIKILLYMVFGLLLLIILPLLLGVIRLEQVNFKYIGFSIILHIILIVGFELLFLLYITTFISPVKLYTVFQNNKNQTGNYI